MARLPEVKTRGFGTLNRHKSIKLDNGDELKFVEEDNGKIILVDPEVAKETIKSILLSEISEYVKGSFNLTCENINSLIEQYNHQLLVYTEQKIETSSQVLAEKLVTRIIKDKMSEEFIDKLIIELTKLKNSRNENFDT